VHAAFPGVDYQIEVFDPTPGAATSLVRSGNLTAVGEDAAAAATPGAGTPARLKRIPASLGNPIFWVGAKQGMTYELTQQANGQVLIRYLPQGTEIGDSGAYRTIGTYPDAKAFASVKTFGNQANAVVIKLP